MNMPKTQDNDAKSKKKHNTSNETKTNKDKTYSGWTQTPKSSI